MEYEHLSEILRTINAEGNLNENNIMEEIKEKLEIEYTGVYED
ncbi:MAG: hypothetical protein ACR5KV_01075 [Wolbachia sp.]